MSVEAITTAESDPRKLLVYKVTPHQLADAHRRSIRRRNVEIFQEAQRTKALARSAAKRLEREIRRSESHLDPSIVGLCQKLKRIGETRVTGKYWRQPRPGRRS